MVWQRDGCARIAVRLMNKFNPIIPPECSLSLLYQQRSRMRISIPFLVFTILAVHVMFLGGLLVQGCKHAEKNTQLISPSEAGEIAGPTLLPNSMSPAPTEASSPSAVTFAANQGPADGRGDAQLPSVGGKGLALKPGVQTALALRDAPRARVAATSLEVDSKWLEVAPERPGHAANEKAEGVIREKDRTLAQAGSASYVVRPGDTLGKIAKSKGTTSKTLRLVNRLPSDQIVVGQILSVPEATMSARQGSRRAQNENSPKSGLTL